MLLSEICDDAWQLKINHALHFIALPNSVLWQRIGAQNRLLLSENAKPCLQLTSRRSSLLDGLD